MPEIGHVLAADAEDGIDKIGRIDEKCPAAGAVATIGGLICGRLSAGSREATTVPSVRQFVVADGQGVSEGVCRQEGDGNLVDVVAADLRIDHSVGIIAVGGDDDVVTPVIAFAGAKVGDSWVNNRAGLVDGQGEHVDAVATIGGLQRVVVGARGVVGVATPGEGLVAADGIALLEAIGGHAFEGQGYDAVASVGTGEDHDVGAGLGKRSVTVMHRKLAIAHILEVGGGRVRVYEEGHSDNTVAALSGCEIQRFGAGLRHDGLTIIIGQLVLTGVDGVVHVIGRVDIQVEGDHGVTAIGTVELDGVCAAGSV